MYVYSRGLNRLRWAGRLAGHVLVAVMPITAFGRALALCPRTHPANGHPGRAQHAKRAVGLTASSGRLCTFDRLRADGRGKPISGAHLRGRDSVLSRCNWQKAFPLSTSGLGPITPAVPLPLPTAGSLASRTWTANRTGPEDVGSPANNTRSLAPQLVLGLQVRAWT